MKAGWNDLQEGLREEKGKKCLVTALGLLGHCKMPKTTQELRIWSNLLFGAVMTTEPVCFIKPSALNSTANPYPRPWLCWVLLSPKKKNGKGGQSLEKGWGAAPGRGAKEGLAHIGPVELQWVLLAPYWLSLTFSLYEIQLNPLCMLTLPSKDGSISHEICFMRYQSSHNIFFTKNEVALSYQGPSV